MEKSFCIFSTDQINRSNVKLTVSALESGIWKRGIEGMPMHVNHDMHRLIGWSLPNALYFAPSITYSVGYIFLPDTKDDHILIRNNRNVYFQEELLSKLEPHKASFISLLKDNLSNEGRFHNPSCLAYVQKEVVNKVFPNLVELKQKDKNGLILLSDLLTEFEYKGQGVFKNKESDYLIFAHSFFRKSLSRLNNFNYSFLDKLLLLTKNPSNDLTVKIAIDDDMVGFAPSLHGSMEFEYFWGPKYNDNIESIKPGLTQYGSNEEEKSMTEILTTEFYWKHDDNNYEFELEEVRNNPAPMLDDIYGCRYVHSIYDKKKQVFNHFDGAIRGYSSDLMIQRLDSRLTDFGRRSDYTKIFRIDGKLSIGQWKSLVTAYLHGNPQIHEYFGLDNSIANNSVNREEHGLRTIIPYSINQGDGVRFLFSYHERKQSIAYEREISIYEFLSNGAEINKAIEFDVYDLKKAIERIGGTLKVDEDALNIVVEDMYVNFPCIMHADNNTSDLLKKTLEAIKKLVGASSNNGNGKVLSFTLAWNMDSKEVRFSFYGHETDLYSWLCELKEIPLERTNVRDWLENLATYQLKANRQEDIDFSKVVKRDGVLFLKRRAVSNDAKIKVTDVSIETIGNLLVDAKSEIAFLLQSNIISPIAAYVVENITCQEDGLNYTESPYSTYLDGATQVMDKFVPLGLYWTDKPA